MEIFLHAPILQKNLDESSIATIFWALYERAIEKDKRGPIKIKTMSQKIAGPIPFLLFDLGFVMQMVEPEG